MTPAVLKTTAQHVFFFTTVLLFSLVGGVLAFAVSNREPPVIVLSAAAANPIVQAGGVLRIEYFVRRIRTCAVNVDRFIYDAQRTRYELPDVNIVGGLVLGDDHFFQVVDLPIEIAPGPATYRTMPVYRCDWLQSIFQPIKGEPKDIPFIVR